MTDLITAEEAQKLLDGTTPGPWETAVEHRPDLGCDHTWIAPASWNPRVARVVLYDGHVEEETANAALLGAAPDLARTVIVLHAELAQARADAKTAVAVAIEKAAVVITSLWTWDDDGWLVERPDRKQAEAAIRALAPEDAIAEVAKLRAERDAAVTKRNDSERVLAGLTLEMDRLTAELAAANARVEGLADLLGRGAMYVSLSMREWHTAVAAALAQPSTEGQE